MSMVGRHTFKNCNSEQCADTKVKIMSMDRLTKISDILCLAPVYMKRDSREADCWLGHEQFSGDKRAQLIDAHVDHVLKVAKDVPGDEQMSQFKVNHPSEWGSDINQDLLGW